MREERERREKRMKERERDVGERELEESERERERSCVGYSKRGERESLTMIIYNTPYSANGVLHYTSTFSFPYPSAS